MASKRKPGRAIPDAQRHTRRLTVHLPPTVDAEIRATAAEAGVSVGALVALAWAVARRGGLDAALALVGAAASVRDVDE